ncbi:Uncharacterised protein [Mycobacterium tuberculosis]|nr:Uncharacterised protein [Mycobacterium tuberculosis]
MFVQPAQQFYPVRQARQHISLLAQRHLHRKRDVNEVKRHVVRGSELGRNHDAAAVCKAEQLLRLPCCECGLDACRRSAGQEAELLRLVEQIDQRLAGNRAPAEKVSRSSRDIRHHTVGDVQGRRYGLQGAVGPLAGTTGGKLLGW